MRRPPQLVRGRLTGDPSLSITDTGRYRFAAPFEAVMPSHGRHRALASAPVLLVAVGPLAERAYVQFTAGDRFLTAGSPTPSSAHDASCPRRLAEFLADALGHDLGEHGYTLDRTRRHPAPEANQHRSWPGCRCWGDRLMHDITTAGEVAS